MYFKQLSKPLQDEAIAISRNIQHPFNYILSEDAILNKLDDLNFSMEFEQQVSRVFLGMPICLFGCSFKNITPLVWHALWALNSPIVKDNLKDATLADLDVFFYLTENGFDGNFEKLKKESECYCLLNYSADVIPHLPEVMVKLIKIAFYPFTFFPSMVHTEGKVNIIYDTEWMANIASIAHLTSGESISELLRKPLVYVAFLFLESSKQNGVKDIGKQPEEETLKMKIDRVCELLVEWFIKKGLIAESEKNDVYKKLTEKEDQNG